MFCFLALIECTVPHVLSKIPDLRPTQNTIHNLLDKHILSVVINCVTKCMYITLESAKSPNRRCSLCNCGLCIFSFEVFGTERTDSWLELAALLLKKQFQGSLQPHTVKSSYLDCPFLLWFVMHTLKRNECRDTSRNVHKVEQRRRGHCKGVQRMRENNTGS